MEGDSQPISYWGYKFTVTAGISDSFETGHTILESILSSSASLYVLATKQNSHVP
jgi:hypothetical protein